MLNLLYFRSESPYMAPHNDACENEFQSKTFHLYLHGNAWNTTMIILTKDWKKGKKHLGKALKPYCLVPQKGLKIICPSCQTHNQTSIQIHV